MSEMDWDMICNKMYILVEYAGQKGATWYDLEQMLYNAMKDYDISTEQEAKQWTNC